MRRVKLFFWAFLFVLTGVEIIADESDENLNQEKKDISSDIPGQVNNTTENVSQPGEGGNNTNENTNVVNFDDSFLSAEKEEEKVSDEEIAANQAILNESVKKNQSGFFGWLGRFFGNILDEINTDRIVDSLWNKSTMKHEGNEEYKSAKGRIDRFLIRKAFRGLFRKYLEGKEINEGTIQKFNGEYDKVKMFADILKNENNDFEDDSLRLIILEKILGDRDDDIRGVLAALDNVSEEKMVELQSLLADLKNNEEEFVKCFADMSAVEKYNLERAAFYDKKGNYCKSQWMMVDKDGIHETSRGFVTWVKNIWKVLRFVIGFVVNVVVIWLGFFPGDKGEGDFYKDCWGANTYLNEGNYSDENANDNVFCKCLQIITCLPSLIGRCRGCTKIISFVQDIVAIIDLGILGVYFFRQGFSKSINAILKINIEKYYNIINKIAVICAVISIVFNFLGGLFGLKYIFNKKINKHLAFLLNKKFRFIKNYVETLKKIHVLIKGDEVLAGAFKKELLSLEKVFGDEANAETKHMLTEMDKQKLYASFDEVKDTGEAMLLFDKNKDIFSDCIVDVNKINACVALKMNVPAEETKKVEEKNNDQEACKKEKDLSSEKVKEVNPEEKRDVKETIDNQTENKKEENEPEEKKDVKEETAKQEENKKARYSEEEVHESKKDKKRGNKKRKRKRSARKRRVQTNKNKRVNRKKSVNEKTSAE